MTVGVYLVLLQGLTLIAAGSEPFEALVEQYERAYSIYETNRFTLRSSDGLNDRLGIFPDVSSVSICPIPYK